MTEPPHKHQQAPTNNNQEQQHESTHVVPDVSEFTRMQPSCELASLRLVNTVDPVVDDDESSVADLISRSPDWAQPRFWAHQSMFRGPHWQSRADTHRVPAGCIRCETDVIQIRFEGYPCWRSFESRWTVRELNPQMQVMKRDSSPCMLRSLIMPDSIFHEMKTREAALRRVMCHAEDSFGVEGVPLETNVAPTARDPSICRFAHQLGRQS